MESHTIPFDTHAFVKRLTAAGMPEEQAEILAETQVELIEERLATKQDVKELEIALKRDIKELELKLMRHTEVKLAESKTEIIKWVAGLLVVQTGIIIGAVFAVVRLLVTSP